MDYEYQKVTFFKSAKIVKDGIMQDFRPQNK
jgi:hypothetical protein